MNRYARSVIVEFVSAENKEYLHDSLISRFENNQVVFRFLAGHFDEFVNNFAITIEQELSMSEPLPGIRIIDQVNCFNNQFIDDRIHFIRDHVVANDDVPLYMVKDNMPTSRHGVTHYQKRPNDILSSWRSAPGRGVQAREDTGSDVYSNNPYQGSSDHMSTGVVFCDQSSIGSQRHQDLFFGGSYIQSLNKTDRPHENTIFGVSTPESDARLLSRRIFRKNEAGVENGIPRYESRLYNRHLERDIDEGLRGAERGCMVSGHDMSSLYARVDHKNKVRARYDSCDRTNQLKLHNNNAKVTDDMRYC